MFSAIQREIQEEFGIGITLLGSDTQFSEHTIVSLPLPIGIHKVSYEHREKGDIEKLEYVFFAHAQDEIDTADPEEIFDRQWIAQEDFFALDAPAETHLFLQELLEQHGDLLEIL